LDAKQVMPSVIVAQNASTKFGGEGLLPLNYFSILRSRQIETLLVVHARTQAELKALFPAIGRSNALSDTWLHRLLNNCGRFIPARVNEFTFGLLSHQYTQVVQRRIVRRLVSNTILMLYRNRHQSRQHSLR
jgi:hypothetical protein